jgi:NAD+ diphosphatase
MNNKNNSSGNFFTSENLNRLSNKRNDEKWISIQLESPDTLFIPLWEGKNLINVSNEPDIVSLKKEELKKNFLKELSFTLLGELNGKIYFSVSLDDYNIDIEKEFSSFGLFATLRRYAALLNKDLASLLAYSNALSNWQKRHHFCGICGSKTLLVLGGHRIDCSNPNCNHQIFPRTDPAIITIIYKDNKCLLVRQPHWQPAQYALVAGFVEPGESLESAVAREVYEETGIQITEIEYFSSQPWPFPGSIMLGFSAKAVTEKITLHDKELEDAKWMTRKDIVEGLRNKTLKNPTNFSIAFRLLESWFNLESDEKLSEIISRLNN